MTTADLPARLALAPLAVAHLTMAEPLVLAGTPRGTVVFVELTEGIFTGRLDGTVRAGTAGDWVRLDAHGSGALDVRFVLEAHDGALLSVRCHGRIDVSSASDALLAMTFETGAKAYQPFNTMLAVARVATSGRSLRYDVYEVHAEH